MSTSLFDRIIFGPVKSRRLGNSLGINLLPTTSKWCNFDCVYCECGWTYHDKDALQKLPETYIVVTELIKKIQVLLDKGEKIDSITFAGNGEPTLHPKFDQIMSEVVLIRNLMIPDSKISILSNCTMLHKEEVFKAILKANYCILKLDAGTEEMFQKINQPLGGITIQKIKKHLLKFKGDITIQSLFLRGQHHNEHIDNTTPKELDAWTNHLIDIKPKKVMLYSIDRPTPEEKLTPIPKRELQSIAERLVPYNIETLVS